LSSASTTLVTLVGLLLCILPGVYLWVGFYVAIPVLLVEGSGPFGSMGRSRRLVKGRWWGTFGVAIVGILLVAVLTYVIDLVLVGVAFAGPHPNTVTGFVLRTLASTIASMLTMPAAAAFATVLYIDLRVRKEGFDLLLLARGIGSSSTPFGDVPPYVPSAPAAPAASAQPPFWPPPPGWTPPPAEPSPAPETEPSSGSQQPPFWPPPPGWQPDDK